MEVACVSKKLPVWRSTMYIQHMTEQLKVYGVLGVDLWCEISTSTLRPKYWFPHLQLRINYIPYVPYVKFTSAMCER